MFGRTNLVRRNMIRATNLQVPRPVHVVCTAYNIQLCCAGYSSHDASGSVGVYVEHQRILRPSEEQVFPVSPVSLVTRGALVPRLVMGPKYRSFHALEMRLKFPRTTPSDIVQLAL
jgi:hypothetical protein